MCLQSEPMKNRMWIAGPCAAESSQQIWDTALALRHFPGLSLFRCGVWKARSHPSDYEGMGESALPVLQRVSRDLKLDICVEVAAPWHVEKIMKYGITTAWIGARTTVNPFLVQELANVMRGTDLHLWIKNPMAPDLKLWDGAFERFSAAGLKDLGAIYRGFATSLPSPYRNHPMWSEYIRWKSLHPEIPLLFDPSHVAGNRQLIKEVAQKALLLDCDGLMVEVHCCPSEALSDANQQLTPHEFEELAVSLDFPQSESGADLLAGERAVIDALDSDLLAILSRRMETVRRIARYKQAVHLPLLQVDRWCKVMEHTLKQAEALHLSKNFVTDLMQLIHSASIEEQERELADSKLEKE